MSADSAHHLSEKALHNKSIADFPDFNKEISDVIQTKVLGFHYFADWPDAVNRHKINQYEDKPKMSEIVVACFRRGKKEMLFKYSPTQNDFFEYALLKRNFQFGGLPPSPRRDPRGYQSRKGKKE